MSYEQKEIEREGQESMAVHTWHPITNVLNHRYVRDDGGTYAEFLQYNIVWECGGNDWKYEDELNCNELIAQYWRRVALEETLADDSDIDVIPPQNDSDSDIEILN